LYPSEYSLSYPFDELRASPSAGSGQALRQAQGKPFGRLRASPSAGSGQVKNRLLGDSLLDISIVLAPPAGRC